MIIFPDASNFGGRDQWEEAAKVKAEYATKNPNDIPLEAREESTCCNDANEDGGVECQI